MYWSKLASTRKVVGFMVIRGEYRGGGKYGADARLQALKDRNVVGRQRIPAERTYLDFPMR